MKRNQQRSESYINLSRTSYRITKSICKAKVASAFTAYKRPRTRYLIQQILAETGKYNGKQTGRGVDTLWSIHGAPLTLGHVWWIRAHVTAQKMTRETPQRSGPICWVR